MTTPISTSVERKARERTARMALAVWAAALLSLLAVPEFLVASHHADQLVVGALILFGYVVSERLVFHIESRNEAVSFSPADIPLALGLVLLPPLTLLAVRIVGGAIGLVIWRKQPLFKFVTNLTTFSVEVVVASFVFRHLAGVAATPSISTWAALVVAIQIALVAGGVLIATAIAFFELDLAARVRREFTHSYLFYLPGALLGASAAVCYLTDSWLIVVGIVPAPAIWLVLRTHGALMHRFSDLAHIHEFSSQVGRSTQIGDIAAAAVERISEHLRAASVDLVVWDSAGAAMASASIGPREVAHKIDTSLLDPHGWPTHVRSEYGSALDAALMECGVEEAIVVGVRHDGHLVATLMVADRTGATDHFTTDDCERLVPITQQLAVALVKGQLQVEIQHQATHDRLTGLPNRAYFEAWAARQSRSEVRASMLLLDLDRFKEVNDTLGHHIGDHLLIEAARRIERCLAPDDMLARLGGDEFAILSPDTGSTEASLLAERISVMLEQPFELADTTLAIGGSIGIVTYPEHGLDHDTLLRRADLAMYDAKRNHNRATVFTDDLEGTDTMRLALLGELRETIREDSLGVHYQPKIEVATGRVVGAEALVRWDSISRGDIPPDIFVPMAAQAGLIGELTSQVLRRAITEASHWENLGAPIGIAVNISPHSLLDESLPDEIAVHLAEHGLPAGRLTLEVTEDSVMNDTPRVWSILERLDRLGVRISVDDFGTGHSSLSNLRRMPVSEIKVDRRFVSAMLLEHNDEVIVHSTVDLAHNLGLAVVAEGVETNDILDSLRSMGCDTAQGYGISRPLPAAHFESWLLTRMGEDGDRRDANGRRHSDRTQIDLRTDS